MRGLSGWVAGAWRRGGLRGGWPGPAALAARSRWAAARRSAFATLRRSRSSARSGSASPFLRRHARDEAEARELRGGRRLSASGVSGSANRSSVSSSSRITSRHRRVGDRVRRDHQPHELDAVLLDDVGQHLVEVGAARVFAVVAERLDGGVVRTLGQRGRDRVLTVDREAAQLAPHERREPVAEVHGGAGEVELQREVLALLLGDAGEPAPQRLVVERG